MKKFVRSLSLIIAFIIFGFGSMFLGFILFPLIKITNKEYDVRLRKYSDCIYKSWKILISIVQFLRIFKLNISDAEKLSEIKNSIIVSTHPSFADVVILMSIIPNTTCYVAEKLTRNPILKNIVGSFFLPMGQPLDKLEKDAMNIINKGYNIIVFPTGTRHGRDEHPKVRKGASLIAIKSRKDIYPIKITTSDAFLQTNRPFYEAGENIIQYDIDLKSIIKTEEYIERYDDEVTLKKELTREISKSLFGD